MGEGVGETGDCVAFDEALDEAVADGVCEGVCEAALDGSGDGKAVCDSEAPLGSELVGVADSVGGAELDGVPSGELDTEAPVERDAVDDSD